MYLINSELLEQAMHIPQIIRADAYLIAFLSILKTKNGKISVVIGIAEEIYLDVLKETMHITKNIQQKLQRIIIVVIISFFDLYSVCIDFLSIIAIITTVAIVQLMQNIM
jgi:hypothetical protein